MSAHRVTNKMAMDLETLKKCGQDLQKGNSFHPDTTGLQIQWPGLQVTAGTLQKSGQKLKDQLKAPSIKWLLGWKHSEIVRRTSECQKCITQTPLDHRCIGPGMQIAEETTKFDVPKMRSLSKSATNQKRDIVDTPTHAFCAFGHSPSLGLAFSTTWEMESKDQ